MKHIEYKRFVAVLLVLTVAGMAASLATLNVRAEDNDDASRFFTRLSTFNEVPPKANDAHGTFRAKLIDDGTTLSWTFTWAGLTGPPLFAHIHFELKTNNGPVMTFFCGGPKGSPVVPPKPDCPQTTSGTITGTTNAGDIIALNSDGTDQALDSHDFAGFLRALRAGAAYANMHTPRFPGGEIRGQIAVNRGEPDDEN